MKITLLTTGVLMLVSIASFAQKGTLNDAKEAYQKYDGLRAGSIKLAMPSLTEAKTDIDKAAANEKTAGLPLTFAVKGAVYSALAIQDTVPATSTPNFKIADEALKKAKSLDSAKQDKETEDLITHGLLTLAQYKFDEGRKEFQEKKYDQAYHSFDYYRSIRPTDTLAIYVTSLSAANAAYTDPKYYPLAVSGYNQLLTTNYTQNAQTYHDLAQIYINMKDSTNAFKTAGAGVAKYPNDAELRRMEITIGLQTGKQSEMLGKIESAIAADPKNKELYYFEATTYREMGEVYSDQQQKTKDRAAKAALEQKKLDLYSKAADQYKKALAIDPGYFEANLSLGYVAIEPAVFDYNSANQLPGNATQKQYDDLMTKAGNEAEAAKPYLLKAVELNPKSSDALTNLKNYYIVKKDLADANATQKKIDAL